MTTEVTVNFETYVKDVANPAEPLSVSNLVNLSNLGPEEIALFAEVWLEIELARRQQIVEELIQLAEDNVELNFDAVYLHALADRDPGVRRAAIQGLWEYEGRDLIDSLTGLVENDADAGVRAGAALALGRFVVQGEFGTVRESDSERIDRALQRVAKDAAEVSEVRARAIESLGARSEDWVRDLIEDAYDDGDRRLRLSAVHAMGRSVDPAWLPTLIGQFQSDDGEMRFEAVVATGAIADSEATPHLIDLLGDDDAEVQEAAIRALGEIADDDAKQALQELAEEGDERLSEAAQEALAEADFEDDPLGVQAGEL